MKEHSEPSKEEQKHLLIEMMREDEKSGMYLRSAEEILKEKLKNIHFIRSDETYALVIGAMTEYAQQFKEGVEGQKEALKNAVYSPLDMLEFARFCGTVIANDSYYKNKLKEWIKTRHS